jgi:serine protease Do
MRAFADLARELSPAIVNISVRRAAPVGLPAIPGSEAQGLGSGFIIHSDGLVLTNAHVIDGAGEIVIKLENEHEYVAKVVGVFPPLDIALLSFEPETADALIVAPLGRSEQVEIGEWVIAIGNPFGLNHTVTAGIVSAKGRRDVTPGNEPNLARFIQTDASINPGNSGGPLINIRGEVIGINTAINAAGQGIGFAVPIDMVKTILPQLSTGRVTRSYLGVVVGPVSREIATQLQLPRRQGALVSQVKPASPADLAGLRAGDVIVTFDGQAIEHWEDLPWLASITGLERPVTLGVNRGGRRLTASARLAPYPEQVADTPQTPKPPMASRTPLGVTVVSLPRDQAKAMGLSASEGVIVKSVEAGTVGAALGILAGDVIIKVNGKPVRGGAAGFEAAIGELRRGAKLTLAMRRGAMSLFKSLVL